MRRHWVALLSMFGLASAGLPVQSQVVKGSATQNKAVPSQQMKSTNGSSAAQKKGATGKLNLNQQVVRQQTQPGGKQADPLTPSAYCNATVKGRANNQLTPPPPGQAAKGKKLNLKQQAVRQQTQVGGKQADPLTPSAYCNGAARGKANQQLTKGNANQQLTKGAGKN